MTENTKTILAFVYVCLIWGTTYLGIRIAIDYMPPFFLSGIRHLIAGTFCVGVALATGAKLPDRPTLLKLFFLGTLMIVGGNAFVCWSEQYISSGLTAIVCALSPLLITLVSMQALKGVHITPIIWLGLLMGLGGIGLIFFDNIADLANPNYRLGMIFLILAISAWSLGSVLNKKYNIDLPIYMSVGIQMLSAALVNLLISNVFEQHVVLTEIAWQGWASMLYLAIFGSILAYWAYFYMLKRFTPARISLHGYINTIIAVLLGWLIKNEPLTWHILLGMCITLSGTFIVNNEYKRLSANAA
jgi:drug/metabolite transporter (DMT)-like permease